jgi:hypothetical protein
LTTTQIEAAAAEFRDWLDGFPLTKTSKDLIAAKAAEIFGRKHAGEAGVFVAVHGEKLPAGWYATGWTGPPFRYTNLVHSEGGMVQVGGFTYVRLPDRREIAQHADQPSK